MFKTKRLRKNLFAYLCYTTTVTHIFMKKTLKNDIERY
jgi:hypothetical protein